MTEPRDENLLHFLASAVESIRDRLDEIDNHVVGIESRMEAGFGRMEA